MLRKDQMLDRSLRTMRLSTRHRVWEEIRRPRGGLVAALAIMSLCMLIAGWATSAAGVIWAFAGVWLVTLLIGFVLPRKRTGPSSR